jgi:hypothetical protein
MHPGFLYVIWTAVGAAVVIGTVFLIRVLLQLQQLIRRIERGAEYFEARQPQIDRLLDSVEAELGELRGVTEKANRIAGSAAGVATGIKFAVQPFIGEVADVGQSLRHLRAAVVAVQAGISAWRKRRHSHTEEPATGLEPDDER